MYSEYSYICSEYIYIYIHMYSEYSYICSEYIYIYIYKIWIEKQNRYPEKSSWVYAKQFRRKDCGRKEWKS